jgi:hypothetical protein
MQVQNHVSSPLLENIEATIQHVQSAHVIPSLGTYTFFCLEHEGMG